MRKLAYILIISIFFLPTTIFAKEKSYSFSSIESCIKVASFAKFRLQPLPIVENGIKAEVLSPVSFAGRQSGGEPLNKDIFCTDGWNFSGIQGLSLAITNETDTMIVVSWKDSVIYVNDTNYGIPSFINMPYRDVGNPSATPKYNNSTWATCDSATTNKYTRRI